MTTRSKVIDFEQSGGCGSPTGELAYSTVANSQQLPVGIAGHSAWQFHSRPTGLLCRQRTAGLIPEPQRSAGWVPRAVQGFLLAA